MTQNAPVMKMKNELRNKNQAVTKRLIQEIIPEKVYGSSLLKIVVHFGYIPSETRITDLADALQESPEILAVGVVDHDLRALGIISRDHLFSLLGKPFGRDILNKRSVLEIAETVPCFSMHANLFGIAQELKHDLEIQGIRLYLLIDEKDRFRGIFTSHNLLAHLSRITQEDIQLAASLQERLVNATEALDSPEWQYWAWSHFAKGVGGDFHFSRKLSEHRHFFTLCDVSGKGVAASIISSMLWGMLRMFDFRRGLRELIIEVNKAVITSFQLEKYLTGIFMVYHSHKRRLTIADLGHSHLLIFRNGRAISVKSPSTNLPIGIDPELEPLLYSCILEAGDRVLVFSDGITEQENPDGEEFGEARLKETILRCIRDERDVAQILPKTITDYRKTTPQQDDMSFIMLGLGPATLS